MKLAGLGDLAQGAALRRQTVELKELLQQTSTEVTTGRAADLTAKVGGDFGQLAGIESSLARLQAYRTAAEAAGSHAGAMQIALSAVETMASDYAAALLTAASSSQPAQLTAILGDGEQRFQAAVSQYNTRFGDRTLFAGQESRTAALVAPETILAELETLTAGMTDAGAIAAAVGGWFDDPAGFAAIAYLGGEPLAPLAVAPGEEAALDITATDPAIRATLNGLALAALLDRGALAGDSVAKATLARRAGEMLMESQTDRAALAARLGADEGLIEEARLRLGAEISALSIARVDTVAIDPYEAATRLELARTQLETIYSITARLSRLSLVDFLR
jgi:flagellar hook-associated protein 3 FlgL